MILVTGATGTVGRPLVDLLLGAGVAVRAVTRDPLTAGLPSAAELLALARARGVRRVVALSAVNVDDDARDQPSRHLGDRDEEVEAAALGSGLEWVSLRSSAFAAGTLRAWGAQIRTGDVVRGPHPRFAEAPIHELDLAAVAVRALLTDELTGHRPELAGPRRSPARWRRSCSGLRAPTRNGSPSTPRHPSADRRAEPE